MLEIVLTYYRHLFLGMAIAARKEPWVSGLMVLYCIYLAAFHLWLLAALAAVFLAGTVFGFLRMCWLTWREMNS